MVSQTCGFPLRQLSKSVIVQSSTSITYLKLLTSFIVCMVSSSGGNFPSNLTKWTSGSFRFDLAKKFFYCPASGFWSSKSSLRFDLMATSSSKLRVSIVIGLFFKAWWGSLPPRNEAVILKGFDGM